MVFYISLGGTQWWNFGGGTFFRRFCGGDHFFFTPESVEFLHMLRDEDLRFFVFTFEFEETKFLFP